VEHSYVGDAAESRGGGQPRQLVLGYELAGADDVEVKRASRLSFHHGGVLPEARRRVSL
jgi:hypothetical protein